MGAREDWARLHGGPPPDPIAAAWLVALRPAARWLARQGVAPGALRLAGLALALLAVPVAIAGAPHDAPGLATPAFPAPQLWTALPAVTPILALASGLVLASALADGLNGAVAIVSDRITKGGIILDSVVGRLAEAAFAVALWAAGAPGWLALVAVGSGWLYEYLRARAAAVGVPDYGPATVGEWPTRVIATALGLASAWPLGRGGATIGAAIFAVFGAAGIGQLVVWLRRADRPPPS